MNKFVEIYNLTSLNQEESENINRPITSNEIETVIKILPTNRNSLVAWWLRIRLPMQGTQVRALVREDPIYRGTTHIQRQRRSHSETVGGAQPR